MSLIICFSYTSNVRQIEEILDHMIICPHVTTASYCESTSFHLFYNFKFRRKELETIQSHSSIGLYNEYNYYTVIILALFLDNVP